MTRPMSERVRDPRWWLDQVLHFLLGGALAYGFEDLGGWGSFGFSLGLGIFRELVQNLRFNGWRPRWDGSKADAGWDVLSWMLGAIVGSLVA